MIQPTLRNNLINFTFTFFLILFCSLLSTLSLYSQVVELYTQEDIDNFASDYPGITQFSKIRIQGAEITNLHGLSQIEKINGNLTISSTSVENLEGLNNLEIIIPNSSQFSTPLYILFNDNLTTLDALENLEIPRVPGGVIIAKNKNLESCSQDFICKYLSEKEYIIIYANSSQCSHQNMLASNCEIDYDNSGKEILLEDGFETWNEHLPINFQVLAGAFNFEDQSIQKVNSITEGDFAISMRNIKSFFDDYQSGDIATIFTGRKNKLNIEFDCMCVGEGICDIFLVQSKTGELNKLKRSLWSIKAGDSTIYTLQFQDISPNNDLDEIRGVGFRSRNELSSYSGLQLTDFIIDNFKIYEEKSSITTSSFLEPKVYPNPTSNFINVEMQDNQTSYYIYNSSGALLSKSNKNSTIDLSDYSNGIYYLWVNDGITPYTVKIIKK